MDLKRKLRIGKYAIPVFLLLIIASVGLVAAAAYAVLSYTTAATVAANPKVCFIKWSDGSKANTFDYAVEVSPGVMTVDENITYGIWNWQGPNHLCSMNILSIGNQTNIESITTYVKFANATVITVSFMGNDTLPTAPQSFTALAGVKYTIWTEITAKLGASGSSVIKYNLKVS